jgi:hypothetical protein
VITVFSRVVALLAGLLSDIIYAARNWGRECSGEYSRR